MKTTTICNKDGSFDIIDLETRKVIKHVPKPNYHRDIDDDSCRSISRRNGRSFGSLYN